MELLLKKCEISTFNKQRSRKKADISPLIAQNGGFHCFVTTFIGTITLGQITT